MDQIYIFGNWKMNFTADEGINWVDQFQQPTKAENLIVALFPPDLIFYPTAQRCKEKGLKVKLGVQNISSQSAGAHTGESDGTTAKKMGATYCLCGHSERRSDQKETDELVVAKAKRAFDCGLIPVICVGESLNEREAGLTEQVIHRQISSLKELPSGYLVAYEPLWAIGTGVNASSQDAEHICKLIKDQLHCPVLYGGSVKSATAKEYFDQPSIDGALVGGASLKPDEFSQIIQNA